MKNLKIKVCVLIGIVLFTIILFTNKSKGWIWTKNRKQRKNRKYNGIFKKMFGSL